MWAFDEHRLGLRPVLRRQWAPKGQRPIAVGHPRYEWLYLYGFVHPGTGEVVWFICSTVDAELLSAVLAAFAAAVGAGEGKLIVLVLDNAGWHISGDLVVPKGIELAFLPSYTPELQPAEHLWPLADEAVANKHFATLEGPRRGAERALPNPGRHAGGDQGRDPLRLVAGRHPAQLAGALISRIRYETAMWQCQIVPPMNPLSAARARSKSLSRPRLSGAACRRRRRRPRPRRPRWRPRRGRCRRSSAPSPAPVAAPTPAPRPVCFVHPRGQGAGTSWRTAVAAAGSCGRQGWRALTEPAQLVEPCRWHGVTRAGREITVSWTRQLARSG